MTPSPIPGLKDIFDPKVRPAADKFNSLADVLSGLINIFLYIGVFLAFYYLFWGAFAYILAKGDKEGLAKARSKISWALIGLVVIFSAFLIAKFASEIFPPTKGGLPF